MLKVSPNDVKCAIYVCINYTSLKWSLLKSTNVSEMQRIKMYTTKSLCDENSKALAPITRYARVFTEQDTKFARSYGTVLCVVLLFEVK